MAHEVLASVRVVLPEGPAEMAGALGEIAEAWSNFLGQFDQYAASSEVTFSVNETRARAATNGTGAKRGRKPKPQEKALPTFLLEKEAGA